MVKAVASFVEPYGVDNRRFYERKSAENFIFSEACIFSKAVIIEGIALLFKYKT